MNEGEKTYFANVTFNVVAFENQTPRRDAYCALLFNVFTRCEVYVYRLQRETSRDVIACTRLARDKPRNAREFTVILHRSRNRWGLRVCFTRKTAMTDLRGARPAVIIQRYVCVTQNDS